jgi:DNA-directed RNA polymerase specialized sigma24 family protein
MEHYDRIKRYIAYKAGIDQAEDLTQQVFLKANQAMDAFRTSRACTRGCIPLPPTPS